MNAIRTAFTGIAFSGALALLVAQPMRAQDKTTTTRDQTTTTTTESHSYDAGNWRAPRGYAEAYPESGAPNIRQGRDP